MIVRLLGRIGRSKLLLLLLLPQFLPAQQIPDIEIAASQVRIQKGQSATLSVTYSIPEGIYLAKQEQFFHFEADLPDGMTAGPVLYPEGEEKNGLITYRESATLSRDIAASEEMEPGSYTLNISASYQFCDENGMCYLPQSKSLATTLTVLSSESPAAVAGAEENGIGTSPLTILQYLVLAFLGGVILNVMPCVLPLLSVRALSLVNQSGQDKKKIFFNSLLYAGGILVSFLVIAGIVIGLKLSGELVGWGFQFQNPGFVLVLSSIIFVFALAMFNVFVITAPGLTAVTKASGKSGYTGSFLTGVFAVFVATPCTAPFLGAALGFAFTQPPLIILIILLFVGLGLSLPFLLLGIWPGIIQRIPKPGNWMNVFKEIMGFLLLGTVIYLLNTLYHQIGGQNLIRVIIFLAILSFSAWLYGRFAKPGSTKTSQWITSGIIVIIVVLSSLFVIRFDPSSTDKTAAAANTATSSIGQSAEAVKGGRVPFSPAVIEELRENNTPFFLTFHAQWCTTCKVNEAAVLSTKDIRNAFERYGVAVVSGDFTTKDETIARWIRKFGKAGVPVNVLYVPDKEEPIVFPEILTKKIILDALQNHLYNAVQEE